MPLYLLQFQCEPIAVFGSGYSYLFNLGQLDKVTFSERKMISVDTAK